MEQYNFSCCLFLTTGEQRRQRMVISHTLCLTMFSGVFVFGLHSLQLCCSGSLCEYGQANSGMVLPKWATKVHNEPFFVPFTIS